jgi:hypothetical protein
MRYRVQARLTKGKGKWWLQSSHATEEEAKGSFDQLVAWDYPDVRVLDYLEDEVIHETTRGE